MQIVITVEGGMVQDVSFDGGILPEVIIADYDIESDENCPTIRTWTDPKMSKPEQKAAVYRYPVDVNVKWVAQAIELADQPDHV